MLPLLAVSGFTIRTVFDAKTNLWDNIVASIQVEFFGGLVPHVIISRNLDGCCSVIYLVSAS